MRPEAEDERARRFLIGFGEIITTEQGIVGRDRAGGARGAFRL